MPIHEYTFFKKFRERDLHTLFDNVEDNINVLISKEEEKIRATFPTQDYHIQKSEEAIFLQEKPQILREHLITFNFRELRADNLSLRVNPNARAYAEVEIEGCWPFISKDIEKKLEKLGYQQPSFPRRIFSIRDFIHILRHSHPYHL